MQITDYFLLAISVGMLIYAAYVAVNIFRSKPVDATLKGFEESSHWDADSNMDVTDRLPIYRYQFNGRTKTYRSHFSIPIPFLQKETHKLYVRKDGKVFEAEPAIGAVFVAVITLLISV